MAVLIYFLIALLAVTVLSASILTLVVGLNIIFLLVTKVPPISTGKKYFARIFQQIKITPQTVIYDLGCGNGDFLLAAAAFQPKKCVGYELSPMPYFSASLKSIFKGRGRAKVYFRDFFKADIRDADIAYVYLVPPLLGRMAQKLKQELKPGAIALVKGAPLPGLKYCNKVILDDRRGYPLYVYKF